MGDHRVGPRRLRATAVGLLLLVAVVAGCGSSGPKSDPTTVAAPTTIAAPTTVAGTDTTIVPDSTTAPAGDPSSTVSTPTDATDCDQEHLVASVVAAGSTRPTEVKDIRCTKEWATGDVIDPVTGDTDAYNLFRYVDDIWVLQGNLQPGCLDEMQAKGVPKAVALQLIGADLQPAGNCG